MKRLSKARRAKLLNQKLVQQRARLTDDAHMMQQGPVKCALARNAAAYTNLKAPKLRSVEGQGELLDHKKRNRATPYAEWSFDYTKVKGYKPIGE